MGNATNFTASLTQEFLKILGAYPRFSTPYHPEGNGLIERWSQTLKSMLHHIIRLKEISWHRYISFLLWVYREVPNATTVKVVKRVKPYYLQMPEGNLRLLHVNRFREYKARVQTIRVAYDIDDEFDEIYETPTVSTAEKNDEVLDRVKLDYLSRKQQNQLKDLLHGHRTLFSGKINS
ncbi:retrovirus-related Pol polyprotein from transposon 17.6 [Trichonephila clavipes]|uniref:Retrovirus-related Pol polyprotein from transposon 17.6 n=1 Tax=Trichonephila clavipes TaxID=2585209 RepID=A0A8X7B956_TRICX|nr:retrovirus-related Pol polyprotein from transposon 17.6 [Trichonephila clavipes]